MIRRLFYLLLMTIPIGRVISASLFESASKVASLTLDEVILCLLVVACLCTPSARRLILGRKIPGAKAALAYITWCIISLLLGGLRYHLTVSQMAFSALYLARWISYSLLFFVGYDLCRRTEDVKRIVKWLVIGGSAFSGFGLIQAAILPDFAFILHPDAIPLVDFDPQGHRLVSTFLDPNIAAGYILVFLLLSLSFWIHGYSKWLWPCLLSCGALLATLSRGGGLGVIVGLVVLMTTKNFPWKRALIAILALALLGVSMYPSLKAQLEERQRLTIEDPSALSRIVDWQLALNIIISNPISGIGFDTLGFIAPSYGVVRESATAFGFDGDLVTICVLTGIVGLVLYMWIFWEMIRALSRLYVAADSKWVRAYSMGVRSATIGLLVSSFFTTLLLYPQIMAVVWILWALGRRLEQIAFVHVRTSALVLKHATA